MKRKIGLAALSLTIVSLLIVGATLAWYTSEDEATNVFTTGNVEIALHDSAAGVVTTSSGIKGVIKNFDPVDGIVPGAAFDKYVAVKNTGNNDAFIRIELIPTWYEKNASGVYVAIAAADLVKYGLSDASVELDLNGTNWVEGDGTDGLLNSYYYTVVLKAGDVTPYLLHGLTFKGDKIGNEAAGLKFEVQVNAYAIQADNLGTDDYIAAWDVLPVNP